MSSEHTPVNGENEDDRQPHPGVQLSERLTWGLVESAPDGMIMVDETGVVLLVNRQIEDMFGYDRAELLGQPVEQLLPEEARDVHLVHRADYRAEPRTRPMGAGLALQGRRRDGTLFPVEISLSPLQGDDGDQLVIAAVRDIRDRLDAEHELAEVLQHAVIVADRERVARDMHDNVIQELFATGMALEATASTVESPDVVHRLVDAVDSIDLVIKQIRSTIFGLRSHEQWGDGVRGQMLAVANSASEALGFEPAVTFTGPVDDLPDSVVDHLSSIAREALSNTARHARASMANLTIEVTDDRIELRVLDNGVGISGVRIDGDGHGLRNMLDRAVSLGGACEVATQDDGGTSVVWQIPRSSDDLDATDDQRT